MPASVLKGNFIELTGDTSLMLDMPWYDAKCIQDLSVGGLLYAVNCDISTQHNNETSVVFFNKQLAEDFELGDLYELVNSGKWTLDKMYD